MYNEHMPAIRDAMQNDVSIFRRGAMFAVCSIRQPTINVPDQLAILFDGAEGENPLFGHKFEAYAYIMGPAGAALWAQLATRPKSNAGAQLAILDLLAIPGVGIVKAGFIAQLMGWDVACLDSRNIAREGRNPTAYSTNAAKKARKGWLAGKVAEYVGETYGKAQSYWDLWCNDVAAAYSRTPNEISELHLSIVPAEFVPF